jgi:hypothetical protein
MAWVNSGSNIFVASLFCYNILPSVFVTYSIFFYDKLKFYNRIELDFTFVLKGLLNW